MKGLAKFFIILVAILATLTVASFILLKTLVTPERIKQAVLPVAEKAVHRKVTLGDVRIGIFSGIELSDLKIMDRAGTGPFVSCGAARLHYDLMPLLHGKVQITEITLIAPEIHIVRNSDGSFNFSDMLEKGPKPKPAAKGGDPAHRTSSISDEQTGAHKDPGANKDPLAILVSRISIKDGKIVFTDRAVQKDRSVRSVLSDVSMDITDFSLDTPFPVKFAANIGDGTLEAKGTISPRIVSAYLKLKAKDIAMTEFLPYIQASLPGTLKSAELQSAITVNLNREQVETSGTVAIENIDFIPHTNPKAALKDAHVSVQMDTLLKSEAKTLDLKKVVADLNGITLNASGTVGRLGSAPTLNLRISLPSQDISRILAALPQDLISGSESIEPSGKLSASALLEGPSSAGQKLLKSANVDIDKVGIKADGIPVTIGGSLVLQDSRLRSKGLFISAKDSTINCNIQAKNVFEKPIVVKTEMRSDMVDLDAILAERSRHAERQGTDHSPSTRPEKQATGPSGTTAPATKANSTTAPSEIGPLNLPVTASGTVYIALLKYHHMPVKDVNLTYTLKDNLLHVVQVAQVAGGTVRKEVNLDLGVKGFRYDGQFDISHTLAQDILAYAAPSMKDAISGILDLRGQFRGQGILPQDVKKNLWLQGDWDITDGQLTKTGVVARLISFLNLDKEINKIDLEKASGNFRVQEGKVIFKGKFSSSKIDLAPEGTVSLDGALNIRLNARLAPQLASKLPAGRLLSSMHDQRGWSILPIVVTGTWKSPGIGLDTGVIKKHAIQNLTNQLFGNKKDKKAGADSGTQDKSQEQQGQDKQQKQEKPQQKLIENAIKGLFGN